MQAADRPLEPGAQKVGENAGLPSGSRPQALSAA
jgi:hypothetical protein